MIAFLISTILCCEV